MITARRQAPAMDVPLWRVERHLGLPDDSAQRDPWSHLIEVAGRIWRTRARPWRGLRHVSIVNISGQTVALEAGPELTSPRLARDLQAADAHALAVIALSAGRGIDDEIRVQWDAGRPDLSMALHAFAAGWVEEWREREGVRLQCALARRGLRVLEYLSPGYEGWPLTDQATLFTVVSPLAGPIELLDSGFLRPVRSTIAVFGVAHASAAAAPTNESVRSGRRLV